MATRQEPNAPVIIALPFGYSCGTAKTNAILTDDIILKHLIAFFLAPFHPLRRFPLPSPCAFIDLPLPPLARIGLSCVGIDLGEDVDTWHTTALSCVTVGEQAHARRYRRQLDATRHLVGRALVRALLARELGLASLAAEFTLNPWGKPMLPACAWAFNIAHAGQHVWVALGRGADVGIDVEAEDAASDPYAESAVLHLAERTALLQLNRRAAQLAFLRCWTRKEAIVKALGEGLSRPLSSFRVDLGDAPRDWLAEAPLATVAGWTVADLPLGAGYHASVAATAPGLPIACHPAIKASAGRQSRSAR